jgi:putative ABC transport system permease protein
MIRQYLKQAWQLLKENPLVSSISILGTALSIAAIMVVVLLYQLDLAGYPPESKRNRILTTDFTEVRSDKNWNRGFMSVTVARECFYTLRLPEAATAVFSQQSPISLQSERLFTPYNITYTDTSFWKVFDFRFLYGQPFTPSDFQSGIRTAVITDNLARKLFGKANAVGETFVLQFMNFRVCGVVATVSKAASMAYADVWMPYTTYSDPNVNINGGLSGGYKTYVLAKSRSDFDAIRKELETSVARFNAGQSGWTLSFFNPMLSAWDEALQESHDMLHNPDLLRFIATTGALLLFLLLVPALNLIGVTQTSMQKRIVETGIRKAFGANSRDLFRQALSENLVISILGGLLGFGLAYVFFFVGRDFLVPDVKDFTFAMLVQPVTFLIALMFTFLLNYCSAAIPASRMARRPIVESLKN